MSDVVRYLRESNQKRPEEAGHKRVSDDASVSLWTRLEIDFHKALLWILGLSVVDIGILVASGPDTLTRGCNDGNEMNNYILYDTHVSMSTSRQWSVNGLKIAVYLILNITKVWNRRNFAWY